MKLNWRTIGEIVALSSVVLSLLFVGFELRLSRSAASTENRNTAAANAIAMKSLIAEHSETWQKGCTGEALDEAESLLFTQVLQAYDTYSFIRWRNSGGGISTLPEIQAPLEIALNMHRFPGFSDTWRNALSQHASGHPLRINSAGTTPWREEVERLYGLLQESESNPNSDIRVCGL